MALTWGQINTALIKAKFKRWPHLLHELLDDQTFNDYTTKEAYEEELKKIEACSTYEDASRALEEIKKRISPNYLSDKKNDANESTISSSASSDTAKQ